MKIPRDITQDIGKDEEVERIKRPAKEAGDKRITLIGATF